MNYKGVRLVKNNEEDIPILNTHDRLRGIKYAYNENVFI
jgi:hypothetical protein